MFRSKIKYQKSKTQIKDQIFYFFFVSLLFHFLFFISVFPGQSFAKENNTQWRIQSIDTMKYSRDVARQMLRNSSFDAVIDRQVKQIAETGATHVAIGTPYDEEFYPFLKRWVDAARSYNLSVWFRGNFSGWEGWFNYKKITRVQHIAKTTLFIERHKEIFADGDIFTPCPECENGGPGDPRFTKDVSGHRKFLIQSQDSASAAFKKIRKTVSVSFPSMNGDVARLIMDPLTTKRLGGYVVVDHYVASIDKLERDIRRFATLSGGKVVLGEFGAPIPDIHGDYTQKEQERWIEEALSVLAKMPEVEGINYWVNVGGSTELWKANGEARSAVPIVTKYYRGEAVGIVVTNDLEQPLVGVSIRGQSLKQETDRKGRVFFAMPKKGQTITLTKEGYKDITLADLEGGQMMLTMQKEEENFFFWLRKLFRQLLRRD